MSVNEKLAKIQQELKAPKGQTNTFGNYKYRSCEDILEAVKPLLGECILTLNDDIQLVGNHIFVKATATFRFENTEVSTTAFARHPETKKGMDDSQITGAASSYARKYALNGLFCIDDTKDADATNNHGNEAPRQSKKKQGNKQQPDKPWFSEDDFVQSESTFADMKNNQGMTGDQIVAEVRNQFAVSRSMADDIKAFVENC